MTLLLITLVILILGYFFINIYRHDNSAFYKLTGYSYLDVLFNQKVRTMHKLVTELEQVKGSHKMLVNVSVPVNDTLQTVDGILLHESGIYVMKLKKKKGWINGREQDVKWKELLHNEKSREFVNPIYETRELVRGLQQQVPDVAAQLFQTVVLFTNDCAFQQIEVHSNNVEVLKMNALKKWGSTLNGKKLSETEIQMIFTSLEGLMNKKAVTLKSNKPVSI